MAKKKRRKRAATRRVARKATKKRAARRKAAQPKTREALPAAKKKSKKRPGKKRPGAAGKSKKGKKANRKLNQGISKDLTQSKKIAEEQFDLSDLSRVDAARSPEVQDLLNQQKSLSDPFSDSYAGNRSGQLQDYVGRLNDATQGYDSRELSALRDNRRREMERGFQSGRAGLMKAQGNLRTGSTQKAAQIARLARDYGQSSADAENDLFIQGADEKRRALTQYGDTVRGLESDEFGRSQQALSNYQGQLNQSRADELEREKINLGQEAADRAAQSGAQLGIMQLKEARRNAKQQNKLIRRGYQSNERIASGGSGGGGGATATPGPSYADELNKLAEQYK